MRCFEYKTMDLRDLIFILVFCHVPSITCLLKAPSQHLATALLPLALPSMSEIVPSASTTQQKTSGMLLGIVVGELKIKRQVPTVLLLEEVCASGQTK